MILNPQNIISEARKNLKICITNDCRKIYRHIKKDEPDFSNDEEWVVKSSEFSDKPIMRDAIDNSGEYLIQEEITSVHVTLDDNLFFHNQDEEEIPCDETSLEFMADIAITLHNRYNELTK